MVTQDVDLYRFRPLIRVIALRPVFVVYIAHDRYGCST
uniref:Uncharacterized protein n=1 Tax=Arundo donax TaxID=35708 RepID=A0A0A9D2A0_ARUDO